MISLDVKFDFFDAVDGRALSKAEMECYSKWSSLRTIGRELYLGEVGCALSHMALWRRLVESEHQFALVLEDDALVGEICLRLLNEIESFPTDWDIINFTTSANDGPFGYPVMDIYRFSECKNATGLVCYCINKNGARKLLEKVRPLRMPIDHYTANGHLFGLATYTVVPQVATTLGSLMLKSTILKSEISLASRVLGILFKILIKLGVTKKF